MKTNGFHVSRVLPTVLLIVGSFFFVRSGGASETDDEATAAFQEGTALFHDNRYAAAADAFRRAYALKPYWKLFYNIGQSEAAAKRYGLALEAFEKYLVLGGDEIEQLRRDKVFDEIGKFRKIVGSMEIEGKDGLKIVVDDIERGTTPLSGPILVAAGIEHRVSALEGDAVVYEKRVRVSGEQKTTVSIAEIDAATPPKVEENRVPAAQPPRNASDADSSSVSPDEGRNRSVLKPIGWSLVGVGAATLIAAAVTGSMALSIDNDIHDDCIATGCPPDKIDERDRMNRLSLSTDILVGTGAAVAGAGIVVWVLGIVKDKKETARVVSILPLVTPSTVGAVWVKEF